jgi:ABC-type nitrate/sulfonate/bicarbonate transport system ATPase subunit
MSPAGAPRQLDVSIHEKAYRAASGGRRIVLRDLAFTLPAGAVGALVGPSGCGKTTLLRIVAGIDADYTGKVVLPDHGKLGMVFQEPRLLPWRTVEQNVRLGAPEASKPELDALFAVLGLGTHRNNFPGELSLGLARRVALARAFAVKPDLLVLDEPFVSLDAALAASLQSELAALVNSRRITTLLVTHDIDEAIGLADRLFLLSASPAHVIADLPVARPRKTHAPEELAKIRGDIARALAKVGG